jgi:preprotein translocase subunit SecG
MLVRLPPNPPTKDLLVEAVQIGLQVLLVITGLFLTLLILLHKGKGGGLSDMFGGGMSSSLGGSSVAERNLDRITVGVALVWFTVVVGLGVLARFA